MAHHLMRFDPLTDLAFLDPVAGIEDFMRHLHLKYTLRDGDVAAPIALHVSETAQAYMVKATMPGLKKEAIGIDLDGNRVSITAETRRESEEKDGATVLRSERYVGQQCRSLTLAQEIDEAAATASYVDGVLELTLPKRAHCGGAKQLDIT